MNLENLILNPWNYVKNYIKDNNLSRKEIHLATGIPKSTIRGWFNGQRDKPNADNLAKLMVYVCNHQINLEENSDGVERNSENRSTDGSDQF